jgi:bifunctional non-homologous end joining protein LigD
VFVDWSQNDPHKTTVNVYSLRATEHPTVSTPVTWDEIEAAVKKKKAAPLRFEAEEVLKRVLEHGDLFAPVLSVKQKLPPLQSLRY